MYHLFERRGIMLEHWTAYQPELAKSYEEKGYWKRENFSQVFDNIAERFWDREALVGGEQRFTYGELKKGSDRLALHFLKMGLKHEDRIVIQLTNIPSLYLSTSLCRRSASFP